MILGIWCPKRCVNDVHAFGLENGIKCVCELAILVVNQEAKGGLAFRELPDHLPGLLSNPTSIGIGGNACQMHPACPKFDEEQDIQPLQPQRIYGEEITGQDLLFVMRHEMPPTLGSITRQGRLNVVAFKYISDG